MVLAAVKKESVCVAGRVAWPAFTPCTGSLHPSVPVGLLHVVTLL